jgi:hypothetical protein
MIGWLIDSINEGLEALWRGLRDGPAEEEAEERGKEYRIVKREDGTFQAHYYDKWEGWRALYDDGTPNHPAGRAFSSNYSCRTMEQAGERINRHAAQREVEPVWHG